MEERNLKELGCEKMKIHPSHPQLIKFLEKEIPQLKSLGKYKKEVFNKTMVYKYIILMNDPKSPILKMTSLDHFGCK